MGLTWGVFIGSFYPSLPKCSPHFANATPPEGQVRTMWPMALSFGGKLISALELINRMPPVANLMGFDTAFRLERISGR